MTRHLFPALLLLASGLATALPAAEVPLVTSGVLSGGSFDVLAHRLILPALQGAPLQVEVEVRLYGGLETKLFLPLPLEKIQASNNFISHAYSFQEGEASYYLGAAAYWQDGAVHHPFPRLFPVQLRRVDHGRRLEAFLDTEISQDVDELQRHQEVFTRLHQGG